MPSTSCPLCQQANHCEVDGAACWCKQPDHALRIPAALRELVPADGQAQCICQRCVEQFHADAALFAAQHKPS